MQTKCIILALVGALAMAASAQVPLASNAAVPGTDLPPFVSPPVMLVITQRT